MYVVKRGQYYYLLYIHMSVLSPPLSLSLSLSLSPRLPISKSSGLILQFEENQYDTALALIISAGGGDYAMYFLHTLILLSACEKFRAVFK